MRVFNSKISVYVVLALALIPLFLLVKECSHSNELQKDAESMRNFYETEKNQLISRDSIKAQQLIDMEQNLMTEISAREILEEEFKRFKEINSHVRFESVTKIETLRVEYTNPNINILSDYTDYIPVDSVKKYFIQIPRDVVHQEQWFSFSGTVDKDHFMIDSMSFINKFDVTIGTKKSEKPLAFLRKKEYTVELISYSPYSKVNYVNNIVIDDKKKNKLVPMAFGAGAITMFIGFKLIQ